MVAHATVADLVRTISSTETPPARLSDRDGRTDGGGKEMSNSDDRNEHALWMGDEDEKVKDERGAS
jgi:hypothetical protein